MPIGISVRNKYPVHWTHSKHESVFINGMQKTKLPPLEILNWLFRYDEETGKLYKIRGSSGNLWNPEKKISHVNSTGYILVGIRDSNGLQKWFKVHQIIYYMVSGVEPLQLIDHFDGDKLNNRFDNLRLTTETVNQRNRKMMSNNTSGYAGVYWEKRKNKWKASITIDGKQKHLGYYDTSGEAYQARLEYVGTFNLHNLGEAFSYRHTNGD